MRQWMHFRINKCFSILICDMTWNLIAINKLRLSELRDSSWTSMHFQIVYNLLIWLMTVRQTTTKASNEMHQKNNLHKFMKCKMTV